MPISLDVRRKAKKLRTRKLLPHPQVHGKPPCSPYTPAGVKAADQTISYFFSILPAGWPTPMSLRAADSAQKLFVLPI